MRDLVTLGDAWATLGHPIPNPIQARGPQRRRPQVPSTKYQPSVLLADCHLLFASCLFSKIVQPTTFPLWSESLTLPFVRSYVNKNNQNASRNSKLSGETGGADLQGFPGKPGSGLLGRRYAVMNDLKINSLRRRPGAPRRARFWLDGVEIRVPDEPGFGSTGWRSGVEIRRGKALPVFLVSRRPCTEKKGDARLEAAGWSGFLLLTAVEEYGKTLPSQNTPVPQGTKDSSPVRFPRRACALRNKCRVSKTNVSLPCAAGRRVAQRSGQEKISAAKRDFLLLARFPRMGHRVFGTRWWHRREWAKITFNEWLKVVWWNAVDRLR